jgi:hypothetical protein
MPLQESRTSVASKPSTSTSAPGRSTAPLRGRPDPGEELLQARQKLESAQGRFLSAAVAFCDGSISAGQLRAVRELLREQEALVSKLEDLVGKAPAAPFVEEPPPEAAPAEAVAVVPPAETPVLLSPLVELKLDPEDEMSVLLRSLDDKMARLEQDLHQGRINASQYRAIQRHYAEQREVAARLRQAYPNSDRWRVVLEEGKTTFLMQLNEAVCLGFALYDMGTRERLFVEGRLPPAAEEAMALLRTFGPIGTEGSSGRMLATQAEDGSALLLIPGMFTAALVVFSQQPPGWQVRALREVHRNFETANKTPLTRGDRHDLIFPDLSRFIRE